MRGLALAALTAAAAVATFGKVLSPQFMLWLVPLAAVAWAWGMYALGVVTTAAIAVTLAWFPERYFDLVDRDDELLGGRRGAQPPPAPDARARRVGDTAARQGRHEQRLESTPQAHPAAPRSALR